MAVDCIGRHARSWRYIQGSTCNQENEGKTSNLGWILYIGVCWTRCMLGLGVCCSTWCQLMIMTGRDREGWLNFVFCNDGRVVDEKERDGEWRWERGGGYEQIWELSGTTSLIGIGTPRIGVITCRIRTCTQSSLKSQCLIIMSPISSHLYLSHPQLYHHLRTWS